MPPFPFLYCDGSLQSILCYIRWLYDTKFQYPEVVDEVHLLELDKTKKTGKYLETCYRQDPGKYGWCRTHGNFYNASLGMLSVNRFKELF